MVKKDKHEIFIRKVYKNNKHYREGFFKIISRFEKKDKKIIIETPYGLCKVFPYNIVKGVKPGLSSAKDKNTYFVNMLKEKNPELFDGYFKVLSDFKGMKNKIFIQNKYGILNPYASNLMKYDVSVKSAYNKEEYYKNYIYDKNDKIKKGFFILENLADKYFYLSNEFGKYKVLINSLLKNSAGCIENCIDKNNFCIKKFNKVHGNKYNYEKFSYKDYKSKGTIICKKHGEFKITFDNHLEGKGCPECGKESVSSYQKEKGNGWSPKVWEGYGKNSKNFSGFKLYLLHCKNDYESFYKIGKTYVDIDKRFGNKVSMPYNYNIIHFVEDSAKNISLLEECLKKYFREYKYEPNIDFNGYSECFKIDLKELQIINIINGEYTAFLTPD